MGYVAIALIIVLFIYGIYKLCTSIADAIPARPAKIDKKDLEYEQRMTDAIINIIEKVHSPEAYLTYINLKDYPKSRNPYWENDEVYESIILFIRRMYATSKMAHGDPFIVDTIQFANLVRSEVPKDTFLDEEVFLATLNAYTTYYFTIDEASIYNNILSDFDNDEILVSDIIFKMRQKYIKEFKEASSLKEALPIIPDLIQILTEVFAEKNITPALKD